MGDLVTIEELCRGRAETPDRVRELIAAGRLPSASGHGPDGAGLFPRTYFDLLDEAGSVDALRSRFEARYVVAADTYGAVAGPDELDDAWYAFLAGEYGARYLDPEPESAIRAARLAASVERLLAAAAPDDWRWRDRLRGRVDALAATVRPWTPPADEDEDGEHDPGVYERLVVGPRRDYPEAFRQPEE
jgi:hypothetical protein